MSAVEAAVAVAADHGLRSDRPVVLSEAWHVLVHLRPFPVVARVTSGAAGVDPGDVERELSRRPSRGSRGAPVVQPSDLLPPGPHRRDRAHARLLALPRAGRRARPGRRRPGSPHDPRRSRGYEGELPRGGRAAEVRAMLAPSHRRMTSSSLCELASRELPKGRRCTGMPTLQLHPDRDRSCLARLGDRLPRPTRIRPCRACLDDRSKSPDPEARAAIAAYGPTTRRSSSRRSRCMPPGWPRRSWSQSPGAQRPRRHSSASCGFYAASAVSSGARARAQPGLSALHARAARSRRPNGGRRLRSPARE